MKQRSERAWMKWRDLISEQVRSGGSVAAFCRERGLSAHRFYYWKRRGREAETPQFVAGQFANGKPAPVSAPGSAAIEVRLSNGRSLVVGPNFEVNHLRALLAVVESES